MKNFFKKFALFLGIIATVSATSSLISVTPVSARDCEPFAGLVCWDDKVPEMDSEANLKTGIAQIATNILTDLSVIAAYLVLGYVIYGGYLYMFSSGDPTKAAIGKKTLTQAFIGLAITISAFTIFSAIRIALVGNSALGFSNNAEAGSMVTNLIQWVIGMGGVVAVIFVVVGAFSYMTANGDPTKLQKAKTTILYAIIGLVIVALAEVLVAFISNLVRESNADSQGFIKDTIITREIANINKEV